MPATYPGGLKTFVQLQDGVDYPQAADFNAAYNEIEAIEDTLGVNPHISIVKATTYADVAERLETIESAGNLTAGKKRLVNIAGVSGDEDYPPDSDEITGTLVKTKVLWFDASTREKVHFSWRVPDDCDTTYDITLYLDCVIGTIETASVVLDLDYTCRADGEDLTAGEASDTVTQDVQTWAANTKYVIVDLLVAKADVEDGDTIQFSLSRDAANGSDDYNYDFGIFNVALQYTCKDPAS